MRTVLSIALLLIVFAVGQVSAAVTGAQAQALISAVPGTTTSATVELTIDGKVVKFTVTKDAVGNVIARPIPVAGEAVSIAQISIGCTISSTGALAPSTVVVINSDQSLVAYNVTLLPKDGGIASLELVGGRVTSVVNRTDTKKIELTVEKSGTGGGTGTFTITLPAGTLPGQYASTSKP